MLLVFLVCGLSSAELRGLILRMSLGGCGAQTLSQDCLTELRDVRAS